MQNQLGHEEKPGPSPWTDLPAQAGDLEPNRQDGGLSEAVVKARLAKSDMDRFVQAWPEEAGGETLPTFTWNALARQLKDLAGSPAQAGLVDGLLQQTRRWGGAKPPEMMLRELLCLIFVVLDENAAVGDTDERDQRVSVIRLLTGG